MEKGKPKVKKLSEIRFSWIIFFLRLAGIPFKMKIMPTLYSMYMITVTICTYSTYVSIFVDVYIHRDDLGHVMTNLRILTGLSSLVWIFFSASKSQHCRSQIQFHNYMHVTYNISLKECLIIGLYIFKNQ